MNDSRTSSAAGVQTHPTRPSPAPRVVARVRDAVRIVVRRVSELPPSEAVAPLRARVGEYAREVDAWPVSPTTEQRDGLSVRLLRLFTEVTRAEAASRPR